ncbi:MAG: cyclic nucleotide-binding domain-containing protein [Bellilinea sp.]
MANLTLAAIKSGTFWMMIVHLLMIFATIKKERLFIKIGAMLPAELGNFPIFEGLSPAKIEWLASQFERQALPANHTIFRQGDPAEYLYLLASGKVIIRYKPYDGPPLTVATIQPGEIFGWSAVLGRHIYTSAAVTLEQSRMYRIQGSRLQTVCDECPETGAMLYQRLAKFAGEHKKHLHTEGELLRVLTSNLDKNGECYRRIENGQR